MSLQRIQRANRAGRMPLRAVCKGIKMLFEIYNEKGRRLFYTNSEECLPSKEQINSMLNAGYKFKVDGKPLLKKAINEFLKGEKL